jgi:phosphoribosylformylglycinamidine synthase
MEISLVTRLFVEKKEGFNVAAHLMLEDLRDYLKVSKLENVRILVRYDIEGLSDSDLAMTKPVIFSEPPVDTLYEETFEQGSSEISFGIEFLPGQYDQRADSAAQATQLMTHGEVPVVKAAQIIVLDGDLSNSEISKIKKYLINPVDSHEASMDKPATLIEKFETPSAVASIDGFIEGSDEDAEALRVEMGLAMNRDDILHCKAYFRDDEKRNPTITEIKLLDTYWSDHCRHTTFMTKIKDVNIADGKFSDPIKKSFESYKSTRDFVYGSDTDRSINLMDMAVIAMKELRKDGKLPDLEVSREINACSIVVDAKMTDGSTEPWLVMFKNETHNHPTEIEPYGGAATCLGGCIRDPLSGRSYVYQAMRVTGAGDPRKTLEETLAGKLPQKKICVDAAHGYSSYGNQIGLATGSVTEVYHEGYLAKRMEIGAVIAGAPKENVFRGEPKTGDYIVLIGGRTGRDGCGGATGSSKEHTEESIETSGAEVQKGNAPTERKVQRLFRNPAFSKKIKVCNDFGAGGISVAIGEIADGLIIDLDVVPKKYEGLDGTELAISESQERMAVLINPEDLDEIIALSEAENLEAVKVADVTEEARVKMLWRGDAIVDMSREFIDTNGVLQSMDIAVTSPDAGFEFFEEIDPKVKSAISLEDKWLANLSDLNVCSQKGLIERFDSTIGAGSVFLPFGGKNQETPTQAMVAKLPLLSGDTNTGTVMSYGFDADLSSWSPYHGALYSVVESVAKVVAAGGSRKTTRLTLQEYFERLGDDKTKWGKPFSALLGAFEAQKGFGCPAIGGKDSMSGTFEDISVPPTLVSFAVTALDVNDAISPEFKSADNSVILIPVPKGEDLVPDFTELNKIYDSITELIAEKSIVSAHTVAKGGIAGALSKMSFGNEIGVDITATIDEASLFAPDYGAIICEVDGDISDLPFEIAELGVTTDGGNIKIAGFDISREKMLASWSTPLESVFPTKSDEPEAPVEVDCDDRMVKRPSIKIAKPRIFMPVFPGTNCEYDTAKVFNNAGGLTETFIVNNLSGNHIEASIEAAVKHIDNSQIVMIPGGFSAGDEPEGSGKFISSFFRNPVIKDAVMRLLNERDGLMLGICNGFQALIKLGLVPYGEIRDLEDNSPTLTFNNIGRHISQMVETRVSSTMSPWLSGVELGDTHSVAVSHGEGRFVASDEWLKKLTAGGQIATQYVDQEGSVSSSIPFNPNGSVWGIEGITSPDGRVFGKMGHSERIGTNVAKNIVGEKDQKIFESGVNYFL